VLNFRTAVIFRDTFSAGLHFSRPANAGWGWLAPVRGGLRPAGDGFVRHPSAALCHPQTMACSAPFPARDTAGLHHLVQDRNGKRVCQKRRVRPLSTLLALAVDHAPLGSVAFHGIVKSERSSPALAIGKPDGPW
jgi:hypothetical protein